MSVVRVDVKLVRTPYPHPHVTVRDRLDGFDGSAIKKYRFYIYFTTTFCAFDTWRVVSVRTAGLHVLPTDWRGEGEDKRRNGKRQKYAYNSIKWYKTYWEFTCGARRRRNNNNNGNSDGVSASRGYCLARYPPLYRFFSFSRFFFFNYQDSSLILVVVVIISSSYYFFPWRNSRIKKRQNATTLNDRVIRSPKTQIVITFMFVSFSPGSDYLKPPTPYYYVTLRTRGIRPSRRH